MNERSVILSVDVESDNDLPRVLEVVGRCMAGLVLEGLSARIYTYSEDEETVE